jgi:hypothetical protein
MGILSIFNPKHDTDKEVKNFVSHVEKSKNLKSDFSKLTKIVNSFFSKTFGVEYKFTYEDLKFELEQKGLPNELMDNINVVCDDLAKLEFDKNNINKDTLTKISQYLLKLSNDVKGQDFSQTIIEKLDHEVEDFEKSLNESVPKRTKNLDYSMFAPPGFKEQEQKIEKELNEKPKNEIITSESNNEDIIPKTVLEVPKNTEKIRKPKLIIEDRTKIKIVKRAIPEIKLSSLEIKEEQVKNKEKEIEKIEEQISQFENFEKLPSFNVAKKRLNVTPIKKSLKNLIKELESSKKEFKTELSLMDKEKVILKQEKKLVKSKDDKLPEFKIFNKKLDDEITSLNHKRTIIAKKELLVEQKINSLTKLQDHLTDLGKEVKSDNKSLKEKKDFIKSKETVIKKIKNELQKKHISTIKEIEKLRQELNDKQEKFKQLQELINKREEKLHIEESNLLEEKRRHARVIKKLIKDHLKVALFDLSVVERKINELKLQDKELDVKLASMDIEHKQFEKERELLRIELKSKKKYFDEVEKNIKKKNPSFEQIIATVRKTNKTNFELENKLIEFEKFINDTKHEVRMRNQAIELKELDLKSIEKEIDRINLSVNNNKLRLEIREKSLNKRIEPFKSLRQQIRRSISREKRNLKAIEKRLESKGYVINVKLQKTKKLDDYYELESKGLMTNDKNTIEREIKITHSFGGDEIGNPNVLDILRLLNKAKLFISSNQKDKSRDTYLEIQRLFDKLNEFDREELYGEVVQVFKNQPTNVNTNDVEELIAQLEDAIKVNNINMTSQIYQQLQNVYLGLGGEQRNKYYNKIMDLYNQVNHVAAF